MIISAVVPWTNPAGPRNRKHDVEGALAHGIPCLGLSMGFAPEGELEEAGAVAVVDTLDEVVEYILR